MILTGPEIHGQVSDSAISIVPYDERQINPASYDLRLGGRVVTYKERVLDARVNNEVERFNYKNNDLIYLIPSTLYLMETYEVISTGDFVGCVDGKSSLGRLGVQVHSTAGYIDPGFSGNVTLEVSVVQPVKLVVGMRFAQIRFHKTDGLVLRYAGNYRGENSSGPVPSRTWKQIQEDRL